MQVNVFGEDSETATGDVKCKRLYKPWIRVIMHGRSHGDRLANTKIAVDIHATDGQTLSTTITQKAILITFEIL